MFNLEAHKHRQHAALSAGAMRVISQRAVKRPDHYRLTEVSMTLRTLSELRDEAARKLRKEEALDAVTAHLKALPDEPAFDQPAPTSGANPLVLAFPHLP